MMGFSSRIQAQFQTALNAGAVFNNVANATHISCDGYVDDPFIPMLSLKVFAWDGTNQGWGYDYNGSKSILSVTTSNTIYHPEIALVSDQTGRFIYAIVLYQDPAIGAFYEAYKWNGTAFPTSPTYTGVLSGGSMTDRVVSIAGDEYGHFVMVCDDGYNVRSSMKQLTGYINTSTGALVFGNIGKINCGSRNISQPDVDITYDANHLTTTDAVVVLAFTRDNSQEIISDFNDQTLLFAGTAWNVCVSSTFAHQPPVFVASETLDQPSISINDGYKMYLANQAAFGTIMYGYWPVHYGVSYREINPTLSQNDIQLYNALVPTGISSYPVGFSFQATSAYNLNGSNAILDLNYEPTIVLQPQEVETVVAWNFDDINSSFPASTPLEGLANRFWYPYNYPTSTNFNQPYNTAQSFDMLVNPNPGITTEVAISGYSENEMLYFYYENNGDLKYKLANYSTNVLRKAIDKNKNQLTIYPNPFTEQIQLKGMDIYSKYTVILTDITGRILKKADGLYLNIEKELNGALSNAPQGCYLLSITSLDGTTQSSKLIKQ